MIALCQKKIYEREVEQSQLDNQIVSTNGDDTQVSPNTPQVLVEDVLLMRNRPELRLNPVGLLPNLYLNVQTYLCSLFYES